MEYTESASLARNALLKAIALVDDTLFEVVMSERQPSVEEIRIAIRRATLAHRMTPVLFGSAAKNCAIQELLDGIAFFLPAPTDRVVWAYDLRSIDADAEDADE